MALSIAHPYKVKSDDVLAIVAQIEQFFCLLTSITLRADPDATMMKFVLTISLMVPVTVAILSDLPMQDLVQDPRLTAIQTKSILVLDRLLQTSDEEDRVILPGLWRRMTFDASARDPQPAPKGILSYFMTRRRGQSTHAVPPGMVRDNCRPYGSSFSNDEFERANLSMVRRCGEDWDRPLVTRTSQACSCSCADLGSSAQPCSAPASKDLRRGSALLCSATTAQDMQTLARIQGSEARAAKELAEAEAALATTWLDSNGQGGARASLRQREQHQREQHQRGSGRISSHIEHFEGLAVLTTSPRSSTCSAIEGDAVPSIAPSCQPANSSCLDRARQARTSQRNSLDMTNMTRAVDMAAEKHAMVSHQTWLMQNVVRIERADSMEDLPRGRGESEELGI